MVHFDKSTPSCTSPKIAQIAILGEESGGRGIHPPQNAFLSILGRAGMGFDMLDTPV
jgi:hypothetical protein